jgi:Secretion system C-terminal sorting domain
MKKILFRILMIVGFVLMNSNLLNAQDFTINIHNTYLVDTLGSEIIFEIDLINNSSQEISVSVIRNELSIPESWSSSLCFDICFVPHLDSISTTVDYGSSPLSSGETRTFSLHVFPMDTDDESRIQLKFVNDQNSSEQYTEEFIAATAIISVDDENTKNMDYSLMQNYPNPFNPSTTINYTIGAKNGSAEFVSLKIFDALGREVSTLINQVQAYGNYNVKFDSKNNPIPSGVYFYELKTDNFHQIKKMILEK